MRNLAFLITLLAMLPHSASAISMQDVEGDWLIFSQGCADSGDENSREYESWTINGDSFKHVMDASDGGKYPGCKNLYAEGVILGTPDADKLNIDVFDVNSPECTRSFPNTGMIQLLDGEHGRADKETFQKKTEKGVEYLIVETSRSNCPRYRKIFIRKPYM